MINFRTRNQTQSIFHPNIQKKSWKTLKCIIFFIGYCFGSIFKTNHFNELYENQQKILESAPSFIGKVLNNFLAIL